MTKARDLANSAAAFSAVSATELGYVDGVTSAIQTQLDAKVAKTLTSTTGDMIYASGANTPARLGIGSSAQVLTVASGVPSWATPAGGGKVLQVVTGTTTTSATNNTTTYADTGLTVTITPTLNTSKILVIVQHCGCGKGTNSSASLSVKLRRDTTDLVLFEEGGGYTGNTNTNLIGTVGTSYLDSPATTSAISYNTQFRCENNVAVAYLGYAGTAYSTITLMEIGA